MVLDEFIKNFWETYNHWYDWINFHYQAWEQKIEIKGKPHINDEGDISGIFFFDSNTNNYRKDLLARFEELKKGPENPSGLAKVCFSLRHPMMQFIANYYIASQVMKKS
ncbi:hypothetical protein KY306_01685 [Candidatus Woesearchaeota archaeon]|nr:hypothetical protein [Candidatus Woesearchaeota archaeon]